MLCRQRILISGVLLGFISNFTYYNIYQRKLKVVTRKKYALRFFIRPLDFSLETREHSNPFHKSLEKNLEVVSKNEGHTSST